MDDLISRSALLEEVRDRILDKDEVKDDLDRQYNRGLLHAIKDVKLAPAVDAEPVRHTKCDFCGRGKPIKAYTYLPDCGLQYGIAIEAIYCPNCGVRMDAEVNP